MIIGTISISGPAITHLTDEGNLTEAQRGKHIVHEDTANR